MKPRLELPHASPTDARVMPCKKPAGPLPQVETFLPLAERSFVLCPVWSRFDVGPRGTPIAGECPPGVLDEADSALGGPAGRGDPDRLSSAARARRRAAAVRPNGDPATRFNRRVFARQDAVASRLARHHRAQARRGCRGSRASNLRPLRRARPGLAGRTAGHHLRIACALGSAETGRFAHLAGAGPTCRQPFTPTSAPR